MSERSYHGATSRSFIKGKQGIGISVLFIYIPWFSYCVKAGGGGGGGVVWGFVIFCIIYFYYFYFFIFLLLLFLF